MSAGSSPEAQDAPVELMDPIDAAGCARLLAAVDLGRLAVVEHGRPHLVVLNYLLDGSHLLFRTGADASLARLTGDDVAVHAVFEADSSFPAAQSGWSVIASGTLTREHDPRRTATALAGIRAWAQGDRDVVLRLDVTELTGRRVGAL